MVSAGVYQMNVLVPPLDDGNAPIVVTIAGASSQAGVNIPIKNSVTGTISVNVNPGTSTLRLGAAANFAAKVNNTSNPLVNWAVNGITGGNSTFGTITAAGAYMTPAAVPSNPAITVTASSQENPAKRDREPGEPSAGGDFSHAGDVESGNAGNADGDGIRIRQRVGNLFRRSGSADHVCFADAAHYDGNVFDAGGAAGRGEGDESQSGERDVHSGGCTGARGE
jgi:hypothetical protein